LKFFKKSIRESVCILNSWTKQLGSFDRDLQVF